MKATNCTVDDDQDPSGPFATQTSYCLGTSIVAVAKECQGVGRVQRNSSAIKVLQATPAGFENFRGSASAHEIPRSLREKPDTDRVSRTPIGPRGSTVARLAALAANAVRACDLVRALAVLDEIQAECLTAAVRGAKVNPGFTA
jgi:hypothetical protein